MNARDKFLHRPKGKLVIERLKPLTKSAVKEMERAFRPVFPIWLKQVMR